MLMVCIIDRFDLLPTHADETTNDYTVCNTDKDQEVPGVASLEAL